MRELAGARLAIRPELAPAPIDEPDRRMLAALAAPRRLDQIWPLARAPRYRLLAFLHFLRGIGALAVEGSIERIAPGLADPRRARAMRLLGVDDATDLDAIKRAYRRLARALHPDLQPGAGAERRQALERRFAEVTAAYEALTYGPSNGQRRTFCRPVVGRPPHRPAGDCRGSSRRAAGCGRALPSAVPPQLGHPVLALLERHQAIAQRGLHARHEAQIGARGCDRAAARAGSTPTDCRPDAPRGP